MLAKIGRAFDSEHHLFEPKWDGFRALAFVEASGVRVLTDWIRQLRSCPSRLGEEGG